MRITLFILLSLISIDVLCQKAKAEKMIEVLGRRKEID